MAVAGPPALDESDSDVDEADDAGWEERKSKPPPLPDEDPGDTSRDPWKPKKSVRLTERRSAVSAPCLPLPETVAWKPDVLPKSDADRARLTDMLLRGSWFVLKWWTVLLCFRRRSIHAPPLLSLLLLLLLLFSFSFSSILRELHPDLIPRLVDGAVLTVVRPTDVIVNQGEPGQSMYLVDFGTCQCVLSYKGEGKKKVDRQMKERTVRLVQQGQGWGQTALIHPVVWPYSVRALGNVRLWVINSDLLSRTCHQAAERLWDQRRKLIDKCSFLGPCSLLFAAVLWHVLVWVFLPLSVSLSFCHSVILSICHSVSPSLRLSVSVCACVRVSSCVSVRPYRGVAYTPFAPSSPIHAVQRL